MVALRNFLLVTNAVIWVFLFAGGWLVNQFTGPTTQDRNPQQSPGLT
jgi:hypothetical protein